LIKNRCASGSINIFTGMLRVGKIIFIILFLQAIVPARLLGQGCTTLGQNPYSAFPVCGINVFTQTSVPTCGGEGLPTLCTNNAGYADINPYWYKFTCYTSGTLGFLITPSNLGDDYDWQLFDITGRDPMDVYKDKSMIVSANWSGSSGITGAAPNGKNANECASDPRDNISTYSTMPNIVVGHEYLLLVSHYDGATQSGYTLTFPTGTNGGTASITNPETPAITRANGVCDGTQILVKLASRVKCSTIASDGSDFSVNNGRTPVNAVGKGCLTGFDSDSILLTLDRILSPGTYTVTAKIGSDGNTVANNCNAALAVGANASLNFIPAQPTPMDSITPPKCITDTLQLVFSKPMNCGSIAADGTDFVVTGPAPVTVKAAKGICVDGVSTYIQIFLSSPIRVNGNFLITLRNGSDGNPLIDECGEVTPAGSTISFTTRNITTADFGTTINAGCKYDTLLLAHNAYGNPNRWQWMIDAQSAGNSQNISLISRAFGDHTVQLTVSNGVCTDTTTRIVNLPDHTVKAAFQVADTLCPADPLLFINNSSANASSWRWNFGNGNITTDKDPAPQSYPLYSRVTQFTASLSVQNNFNCTDIAYKIITILASCHIAVPSAFTPNGDGLNDYFYPLNAFKANSLVFRVFNRYGQIIFESNDWTKKWDGRYKSIQQPPGTYVWTFSYTDRDTGEKVSLKGTTVLIR
jgi:gliding motility-associated-like protein